MPTDYTKRSKEVFKDRKSANSKILEGSDAYAEALIGLEAKKMNINLNSPSVDREAVKGMCLNEINMVSDIHRQIKHGNLDGIDRIFRNLNGTQQQNDSYYYGIHASETDSKFKAEPGSIEERISYGSQILSKFKEED